VVVEVAEPEVRVPAAMPVVRLAGSEGPLMEELARLDVVPMVWVLLGLLPVALVAEHVVAAAVRVLAAPEPVARSGLVIFW
jgi:hypothetical protein